MQRRNLVLCLLVILALFGCKQKSAYEQTVRAGNLTSDAYTLLPEAEKVRYKNITLRVPSVWGGALVPLDRGPYPSVLDKVVHGGELGILTGLYNQSLFELQNPRVKVEYVNFDMWTDSFRSALAVALSSGKAPAYYIARALPQTIEQGMYADLTDLMKDWDQYNLQPEGSIREGTVNGRHYTLAANELGSAVIRYRKDWFREIGVFNEHGEPGPRSDWTWEDFRKYAKLLTIPGKRTGFANDASSMLYVEANGMDYYVPDSTGRYTWRFNDKDPRLLESLKIAREMIKDGSVTSTVSMGWFERHNEFDSGRTAMIPSFAPHIPRDSVLNPTKMGKDKPFKDTVGMVPLPRGSNGYNSLRPITNPIGFDPTLSKEELKLAFEWCKSWFYGDMFLNRMRAATQEAKLKGKQSEIYVEYLVLPYTPKENLLDKPLESVFPPDYLSTYKAIRAAHAPPLPREFGIQEPASSDLDKAVQALYSEAISSQIDLKELIAKHANLINTNLLQFSGKEDRERLKRYVEARTQFYRTYLPKYYEGAWKKSLDTIYRLPSSP
jgi:hypothetical protein